MYGDPFLPDYEEVYTISSGGYDWAEMRVFQKDDRLFYATGGGCSCTYFEEQVAESDLIELATLEAARAATKSFLSENSYHFTNQIDRYTDAVEKFHALGLR